MLREEGPYQTVRGRFATQAAADRALAELRESQIAQDFDTAQHDDGYAVAISPERRQSGQPESHGDGFLDHLSRFFQGDSPGRDERPGYQEQVERDGAISVKVRCLAQNVARVFTILERHGAHHDREAGSLIPDVSPEHERHLNFEQFRRPVGGGDPSGDDSSFDELGRNRSLQDPPESRTVNLMEESGFDDGDPLLAADPTLHPDSMPLREEPIDIQDRPPEQRI